MTEEMKRLHLGKMHKYFAALPTCNRKLAEFPFVLEKLQEWELMYDYITDIPIFRLMYMDPIRKQQFLHYMDILRKSPEQVQRTLREKFESHFRVSRRWFCDAFSQLCGGPVLYYELNPKIYRSSSDLLYFDDVVYYVTSYFELHGKHEECLRDLEASLKALYGTADIFQITRLHQNYCRFPDRVARIILRLCRLYSVHLKALIDHWLATNDDGVPRNEVPDYLEGVDVSWWTTPVPEGCARTLPMKLKLCYLIAELLARNPETNSPEIHEVQENEKENHHLAELVWNTGLKQFVRPHQGRADAVAVAKSYGRSMRDPRTLQTKPPRVTYPSARQMSLERTKAGIEKEKSGGFRTDTGYP
eukprot:CAMPEP_0184308688 /NCGR_PEP_ID=MMETSP1049-20130417/17072_1 /TAXON_ID=77928 /ORGANISM="Proteomonas sulcata, Strain CCMP704" /LENGTH=359 /DNA_ID=CAMNT_0026621417 /DNA_START=171 /DNA_END=1250 /DNA_ORIENTATION=+